MEPNQEILEQMQNQINALQQQLMAATEAFVNLGANMPNGSMKAGNPEKFKGQNARAWLQSVQNVFDAQANMPNDQRKINYAVSYMAGEGLQWWELIKIDPSIQIITWERFMEELLNYFEPVNREQNARKTLSSLKQMGRFNSVHAYNKEFSKWLLQIPSMAVSEQLFHYNQGLKHKIRIEVEKSDPESLQQAMKLADKMDNLMSNRHELPFTPRPNLFGSTGSSNGPIPMQIGSIKSQRRYKKPSPEELEKRRKENLCFICGKPNCWTGKHRNGKN